MQLKRVCWLGTLVQANLIEKCHLTEKRCSCLRLNVSGKTKCHKNIKWYCIPLYWSGIRNIRDWFFKIWANTTKILLEVNWMICFSFIIGWTDPLKWDLTWLRIVTWTENWIMETSNFNFRIRNAVNVLNVISFFLICSDQENKVIFESVWWVGGGNSSDCYTFYITVHVRENAKRFNQNYVISVLHQSTDCTVKYNPRALCVLHKTWCCLNQKMRSVTEPEVSWGPVPSLLSFPFLALCNTSCPINLNLQSSGSFFPFCQFPLSNISLFVFQWPTGPD